MSFRTLITLSFAVGFRGNNDIYFRNEPQAKDLLVFLIFHHILNILSLSPSSGPNKPHCHSCALFRKVFHSSVGNVIKVFSEIPWVQRLGATYLNEAAFLILLFYAAENVFFFLVNIGCYKYFLFSSSNIRAYGSVIIKNL